MQDSSFTWREGVLYTGTERKEDRGYDDVTLNDGDGLSVELKYSQVSFEKIFQALSDVTIIKTPQKVCYF